MNPKLPASVIAKAIAKNAPRARAEYENRWRDDLASFIGRDLLESAVDNVTVRAPEFQVSIFRVSRRIERRAGLLYLRHRSP